MAVDFQEEAGLRDLFLGKTAIGTSSMAECKVQHADVSLTLSFTLGESEARALEALAGYGTDAFLEVFYAKMGKGYLRPHEAGLRSLFVLARSLNGHLDRVDQARRVFNNPHELRELRQPRDMGAR
jgi:hypothetical protein